jgi:16S rRNA processing protein RimM
LVSIGKILRSQGKYGELKLRLYIEKDLSSFDRVFLERGTLREYEVESLRIDRNSYFLKLKGIDTLAQADSLVGLRIYVPEETFAPLEDGTFYHFQIIDSTVLTKEGEVIGLVKGIVPAGGSDLLAVDRAGREVLIPFTKAVCVEVDLSKREIRVDLPDGLLDLNEI